MLCEPLGLPSLHFRNSCLLSPFLDTSATKHTLLDERFALPVGDGLCNANQSNMHTFSDVQMQMQQVNHCNWKINDGKINIEGSSCAGTNQSVTVTEIVVYRLHKSCDGNDAPFPFPTHIPNAPMLFLERRCASPKRDNFLRCSD